MSTDSSTDSFTIERIEKGDPRLKQYLELPEEEKQSTFDVIIQLLPGSDQLEIEEMEGLINWVHFKLTVEDFITLEALGLKGKLRVIGYGSLGEKPFKSRTLIVMQHQIKVPVDLLQPNNCDVIYYQVGDEWRKFPAEAPVLKKRIRLTVDSASPLTTLIWTEAYFGSEVGGGGSINWADAR
jgi:hypothetical protein